MERSSSEPDVRRTTRRLPKVKAKNPEAWQKGWVAHPLCSAGPRWSFRREGFQQETSQRSAKGGSFRDRSTWIQAKVAEKQWVPGPGSYRTEREILLEPKEEVNTNATVRGCASEYSFPHQVKETSLRSKDVKPQRNSFAYPKLDPEFTPGPGAYTQFTSFGSASGGHRQAYFGGKPRNNWDMMESKSEGN